jgi:hypothetical protein
VADIVRNVTIFTGTKKHLAKRFVVESWEGGAKGSIRVHFMEKGARTRWWLAMGKHLVILDGWDHPEFYWPIRAIREAPVQELRNGITVRSASITIAQGEPVKTKYQLEFETYIRSLEPSVILLDTRQPDA